MRSDLIATIDTDRLAHNVRVLRSACRPDTRICAALKADAYGHGLAIVAPVLHDLGIEMAAVATLVEAIELRRLGWQRPILVLGNVLAVRDDAERRDRIAALVDHDLTFTAATLEPLADLGRAAAAKGTVLSVHVKFDTGMGRQGVRPEELPDLLATVRRLPGLRLAGLYSHFATADLEQRELAHRQLATFRCLLDQLADQLPANVVRHLANTAATLTWPEAHFDMVRPGLGVYGYAPGEHMLARFDLRPILRLTSHVTLAKVLPAGHCVGYGNTFTTKRQTRLGIVPVGYDDGLLRGLSNRAMIGTEAGDAPVIGRISMDQLAIDLTDIPSVGVGSPVVLIDEDPQRPNSVAALARLLGTIPYEITCLLGRRIDRVAIGGTAGRIAAASEGQC